MMTSPSEPTSRVFAAGKDSTLVGLSKPRHSRLSVRIFESSVSTIASAGFVEVALAAACTAFRTMVAARGCCAQRGDCTMTSIGLAAFLADFGAGLRADFRAAFDLRARL